MTQPVVDTSVLVRIFDQLEGGHSPAAKLGLHFVHSGTRIRFPFHAIFEVFATLKRKTQDGTLDPYKGITESNALLVEPIPVDQEFLSRYFDVSLPYLKAGDLLFVAMAKKDGAVLITEDNQQYNAAKAAGVDVCRIDEYLARVGA